MIDERQVQKALEIYGLSAKQALVYLACLRLGIGSTQDLAHATKIARSTIYSVLESLIKKDLVITFDQGKTARFSPVNPQKLVTQAIEKSRAINSITAQLKELFKSSSHKPKINYYEGQTQIIDMHWKLLKIPHLTTYDILSPVTEFINFNRVFVREFMARRADLNIRPRIICKDCPEIRKLKKQENGYKFKIKIVPEKLLKNLTSLIYILPKRVVFFGAKQDRIAVSIESEEIREPIKIMFDIFWNSSLEMTI